MGIRGGSIVASVAALALSFAVTGTASASEETPCDDSLPGSNCAPSSLPGSDLPPAAPVIKQVTQTGFFFEGSPIRFAVTVEDDRDAQDQLRVTWTFSDGGSATGLVTRHVFGDPGLYTVRVTVTDTNGNVSFTELPLDHPIAPRRR
jgi:hypothetical protein